MNRRQPGKFSQNSLLSSQTGLPRPDQRPNCPTPARAAPAQQKSWPGAHFLIGGVVIFQIAAVLIFLLLLTPAKPDLSSEAVVSFAAPAKIEPKTVLPEQPQPPTDFARDQIGVNRPGPPTLDPRFVTLGSRVEPLRVRGLEITQGIQVFNEPENPRCHPDSNHPNYIFCNNSMPLVAGRHTMLRLYLGCNEVCPAEAVTVLVHLLKEGQEQTTLSQTISPAKLAQISNLPIEALRLHLDNSVNLSLIPAPEWLVGEITFEVEIVSDNQLLAGFTTSGNFAERKALRVAYLPIQYQGITPDEPQNMDYWLLRMYPVPAVIYERLPMADLVWDKELSKAEILRELLYIYWLYTEHQSGDRWPDQLFGWFPEEYYNGGASDPAWCENCAGPHSGRVAFGGPRPEQDIGGPRILAHEIAHNLGAKHAWSPTQQEDARCFRAEGADIRVDPSWPYAETPYIQEVGIDLYSDPPIIHAPSVYDMMAYCTDPWISPHTYRKIFDSPLLQPDAQPSIPAAFQPQEPDEAGPSLLISGIIYPNGTVSRPEIVQLETQPAAKRWLNSTPAGQEYCLELYNHQQEILARRCFDAGFIDMESGLPSEPSPYFIRLPNTNLADVGKIALNQGPVSLINITPSPTPPQVRVTFPSGGERLAGRQTITWAASDADGDSLTYDLLYSPDGGQSWLPLAVRLSQTSHTVDVNPLTGSRQGLIRVIASDGFHTSTAETPQPFNLAGN